MSRRTNVRRAFVGGALAMALLLPGSSKVFDQSTEGDDAALVADSVAEPVPPKIVLAFDYLHLKPVESVQAKLYPLRPLSGSKWDGMLAVGLDLSADEAQSGDLERDFGGVLYHGSKVTHRFDRRITLENSSANLERRVVYLEPLSVKPEQHSLRVVVSDPVENEASEAEVSFEVDEVPPSP